MGKSSEQTVGYKYFVGVHMALCHASLDKITKIRVDDKEIWSGDSSGGTITIDKPDVFGGTSREGGIVGTVSFLPGGPAQAQNSYLVGKLGALVPAFRGIASLVLEQVYMSMNPYLKPWSVLSQRIHKQDNSAAQWQDSLAQIDVTVYDTEGTAQTVAAMNPAHIIRECLTNTKWGMGYTSGDLDDTTFLACAQTLYDEGMGMCFVWDTQKSIEDFVKVVLQHIEAVIDVDRRTGKFCLYLVRNDYDVGDLITLDPSNVDRIEDLKRPVFGELCTSVTVNYWDVLRDKTASLTVQDIALEQEQGTGGNNTTVTFEGFVDPVTVDRVAQRELVALSTPLISCTIYASKVARHLRVGRCFILSWPDYQIDSVVMRVTEVAYGNGKNRSVRLKCAQDVFSYPEDAFVVRPSSGWVDPATPPGPAEYQMAFEAPYYELIRQVGQSTADSALTSNPYVGYVCAAASPPSSTIAISGELWTNSGAGYAESDSLDFCAGAELASAIGLMDTTFTMTGAMNQSLIGTNEWLQIGDELLAVVSRVGNDVTVKRGALDTYPQAHAEGAPILFWDGFAAIDPVEYVASDTVDVKLTTVNGSGVYPVGSATAMTVDVVGRAYKPFGPKNVRLGGEYYPPESFTFDGDIVVTWAHRNRKIETGGTLLGFTDASITSEAGVEYEIRVYDSTNTLVETYTGITGTTFTVPAADLLTLRPFIYLELDSYRGDFYSFQKYRHQVFLSEFEETEAGVGIETESGDPLQLES